MKELGGSAVSDRIEREIDSQNPGDLKLCIYLIGQDEASAIYARSKVRKGEKLGITTVVRRYESEIGQERIIADLQTDAGSDEVDGIMIERPVPLQMDLDHLINEIPPLKDVEGLNPVNYGYLARGDPVMIPPTSLGAVILMLHYGIEQEGKDVVVLGRSLNVGKPLAFLLSSRRSYGNSTVTQIHSRTRDLPSKLRDADIVFSAVGKPGIVNGSVIKQGVDLIDVGISTIPGKRGVFGDVDAGSVESIASSLTPTPGGTGPVTVSSIFLNLCRCRYLRTDEKMKIGDGIISKIY
jgi:methylenetetrahydrofolate dehydrogenase (NADP+)/methenyltetrahydrofolate cyclohydrolase